MKTIKLTIEWDGKTYTDQDIVHSESSDVNPGDKTLSIMGESLELMMIKILTQIVNDSKSS